MHHTERLGRLTYFIDQIEKWVKAGLIPENENQTFVLNQIKSCVEMSKLAPEQDGVSFEGYGDE